ncbi:hypothetical protein Csa_009939 [Cucumis sativus]|nr:hypothetical protein Csa_009939 [Cucumis sativus]
MQVVRIDDYNIVRPSELALKVLLSKHPVCISISVDEHGSFKRYGGGIYKGPFPEKSNHSMLAVRYTSKTHGDVSGEKMDIA